MSADDAALARSLLSASAVRSRAHEMLALCEADHLTAWRLDRTRLPAVADLVLQTIGDKYPSLVIPFHARWRHFVLPDGDRGAIYREPGPSFRDAAERARAAFDLAIVSVLLDAGAGEAWTYKLPDGTAMSRSEGLAIASLDMFEAGVFSDDAGRPRRADSRTLVNIDAEVLRRGFRADAANPLVGLEGRAQLLNALGRAVAAQPDVFARADAPRPGGLFDHLLRQADGGRLEAPRILEALLLHLGTIWPSRLTLAGVPLGDTWRHPAIERADATNGCVPFHKLSQWLSYSLIEPLQWAGVEVTAIDGLTGLPEYRNGGLFVDTGALLLKDPADAARPHAPGSPLIVEWRALTVALLDEAAGLVRARLDRDATSLPLAAVLEGGTWAAGRRIAAKKRPDGSPPIRIVSDGTVF